MTMVAMVVTWIWLGNISTNMEPSLKVASHIKLVQVQPQLAKPNALMENHSRDTSALMAPLDNQELSNKSSQKSLPTVQLKVLSLSALISSTINQVSIPQQPQMLLVVTPSRSSVGELRTVLHTGSALTHGVHHGECKDSSRSSKENAELKTKFSHAHQAYDNELFSYLTQSLTKFE